MSQLDAMVLLKKAGTYNESLLILAEPHDTEYVVIVVSDVLTGYVFAVSTVEEIAAIHTAASSVASSDVLSQPEIDRRVAEREQALQRMRECLARDGYEFDEEETRSQLRVYLARQHDG